MVHIRVTGRPDDIQAAIAHLDRVMYVTQASGITTPLGGGATYRDVTAALEPLECDHPTAVVVRRGQAESIGPAAYLVEYGLCQECSIRVVRVRVEAAGELLSVSVWSELIEASTSKAVQAFSA
jgi:hypothetical protein